MQIRQLGWRAASLALVVSACGGPSGPGELEEREARAIRPAAIVPATVVGDVPELAESDVFRFKGRMDLFVREGQLYVRSERDRAVLFNDVMNQAPNLIEDHPTLARINPEYVAFKAEVSGFHGGMGPHAGMGGHQDHGGGSAQGGEPHPFAEFLLYDMPEGWEEAPGDPSRVFSLRPAGDPLMDCSLTLLPSDGGGLTNNVNRWRGQMGLSPLESEEILELPTAALLGGEGLLVELEGTYTPMMGTPKEDFGMVGLIAPLPGATLFAKMTGPVTAVGAERENFLAWAASLRPNPEAEEKLSQEPEPEAAPSGQLTWTAGDLWRNQGERMMRLVSYSLGEATECWLSMASGDRLSNYQRWCSQVGAERITEEGIDALPRITILGEECPLLSVQGSFQPRNGNLIEEATMVATMVPYPGREDLFVKMIGPTSEVDQLMDEFLAFCASIEIKE